jgi:hypothetical protein
MQGRRHPEDKSGQLLFAYGYLASITIQGMRKCIFEVRHQVRQVRQRSPWRTRATPSPEVSRLMACGAGLSKTATEFGGLPWQGCQRTWRSSFRIAHFVGIFHQGGADFGRSRGKDANTHQWRSWVSSGQKTRDRRQESGTRGQESEGRGHKTEDRGQKQKSGSRRQKSEGRGQRTEDRSQEAGGKSQRTEGRGQRSEERRQEPGVRNQEAEVLLFTLRRARPGFQPKFLSQLFQTDPALLSERAARRINQGTEPRVVR